jgi:hypothetical protein
MKFIGGIQNFRIENNSISISLPYYHRAATGLLSGAEVYAFPKISTITNAAGQETQVKEIIISPFNPKDWHNIYELDLIMDDKPGMINLITEILMKKSINIYIQESLITNDEQNFSVNLIVDVNDFRASLGSDEEMKKNLENSLLEIGTKLERYSPCRQLRNNSYEVQSKRKTNNVDDETLRNFYFNNHSIQIRNKELGINKQLIQALFQDADTRVELQGTVFSDTDEKMIIVRFFNRDQLVVNFDIEHSNKLGAIFHYSSLIKKISSSYNIISCYNRVEDVTETGHWYVMLDVSHDVEKLYVLFTELSKPDKYFLKLNIHKYSKSIENITLSNLYQHFPSQSNLLNETKKKELDEFNENKYREAMKAIVEIQDDFNKNVSLLKQDIIKNRGIIKNARNQYITLSIILILICSYLIVKTTPKAEWESIYIKVAAIGAGLMVLVHFLVVYLELPQLIKRIFKKGDNDTETNSKH